MALSRSILKNFAKVTNDRATKTNTNTYVYGTAVVGDDGSKYVKMDGSNQVTPVSRLTDIEDGDRVMVSIQDHRAVVIGNLSYPPSARTANQALANTDYLRSTMITTDTLAAEIIKAGYITADQIEASYAKITELDAKYLNTDFANINTADIKVANIAELFATVGLIDSAVISEGKITGYLDAVSVNANSIKAGTLSVDRLIINGTNESLIYALNNAGNLTSTHCDTLDGGLLTERTITNDKIVTHSITSTEITTENIVGSSGWINLAEGTFNYGGKLSWDGSELKVIGNIEGSTITGSKFVSMDSLGSEIKIEGPDLTSTSADKLMNTSLSNGYLFLTYSSDPIRTAILDPTSIKFITSETSWHTSMSSSTFGLYYSGLKGDPCVMLQKPESTTWIGAGSYASLHIYTDEIGLIPWSSMHVENHGAWVHGYYTNDSKYHIYYINEDNIATETNVKTSDFCFTNDSKFEVYDLVTGRYGSLHTSKSGNFGLYDSQKSLWMIYNDINGKTHYNYGSFNGTTSIYSDKATAMQWVLQNSVGKIDFRIAVDGNAGIYSETKSSWLIWHKFSDNTAHMDLATYFGKYVYSNILYNATGVNGIQINDAAIRCSAGSNKSSLGNATYLWTEVYATNGVKTTSDEREKDILTDFKMEDFSDYFMSLNPILYRWRTGSDQKIHFGLGAQTSELKLVEAGYVPDEFSMVHHDILEEVSESGLTDRYSMDYHSYNMLTMMQTQKNTRDVERLKQQSASQEALNQYLMQQLIQAQAEIGQLQSQLKALA